jgi:hypothetical protein
MSNFTFALIAIMTALIGLTQESGRAMCSRSTSAEDYSQRSASGKPNPGKPELKFEN